MDKTTFFALLTDEAAKPDAAFIKALRAKVIATAGGAAPPASGGGSIIGGPTAIIAGVVATIVAGGATFGVLVNNPDEPDAKPVVSQSTESSGSNTTTPVVLGEDTDDEQSPDTQDEEDPVDVNATEPADEAQADEDPAEDTPDDDAQTPDQEVPDRSVDPVAPTDGLYTVSFWETGLFKTSPSMPTSQADLVLSNIEELDFDWGTGSPDATIISSDYFVAKAEAIKYYEAGNYKINMSIDDGVRVYINGSLIYDRWSGDDGTIPVAFFSVKQDSDVHIMFEYYERIDEAIFKAYISEYTKPTRGSQPFLEISP